MLKYTRFFVALVFFVGCSQPTIEEPDFVKRPEPTPKPLEINYFEVATDQQYEIAKKNLAGKPIVEYYSAVWCGYCTKQTPIIRDLSERYKHVTFLKIDFDNCANTAKDAGIQSLPTTVVAGKKLVGLTSSKEIEKWLQ